MSPIKPGLLCLPNARVQQRAGWRAPCASPCGANAGWKPARGVTPGSVCCNALLEVLVSMIPRRAWTRPARDRPRAARCPILVRRPPGRACGPFPSRVPRSRLIVSPRDKNAEVGWLTSSNHHAISPAEGNLLTDWPEARATRRREGGWPTYGSRSACRGEPRSNPTRRPGPCQLVALFPWSISSPRSNLNYSENSFPYELVPLTPCVTRGAGWRDACASTRRDRTARRVHAIVMRNSVWPIQRLHSYIPAG